MDFIKQKIREVFEKCQERRYNLTKLAEVLKKFYLDLSGDAEKRSEFQSQFLYFVECLLQDPDRDLATERCLQFIAIFSAHFADTCDEEEEALPADTSNEIDLYNFLINHIVQPEMHCHSNKTVRFRICQIVSLLLSAVPQNAALDEDLMDSVTKVMLDRIQDKVPSVRAQAAKSLSRLQQPSERDCPVIEAYLFHLACDDSPQVRAAVLSNISLTTKTLPCVVDRTRDISENVRKIAFQTLAQKVSIKALTSSQRLYLIKQGLSDRSEAVREVMSRQVFQAWLLTFDANLVDLLKKLDVVGAHEVCCRTVNAMFQCFSLGDLMEGFALLNKKKLISLNELTPESVLYWSQLCEFMRKKGGEGEENLDKLLPSPLEFSEYLDEYITEVLLPFMGKTEGMSPEEEDDKIEKEFIAEQLVNIAVHMDLSDNAGRKGVTEVFQKAITSIDVIHFPCLVPPLSRGLLDLHPSHLTLEKEEEGKVLMIASLVSASREETPCNTTPPLITLSDEETLRIKQEIAKVSVLLNIANDDLEKCIAAKEFEKAGKIQKEIDEASDEKEKLLEKLKPKPAELLEETQLPEKDDPATVVKCLLMVKELLSSLFESRCLPSRIRTSMSRPIHPTLLQLVDTLVIPSMLNSSPDVRKQAARCLGVGCMFSASMAARHFALLMQVAQADVYTVRVAAINALNDLVRLFGVRTLVPNEKKSEVALPNPNGSEDEEEPSSLPPAPSEEEYNDVDVREVLMNKIIDMLEDEELEVREAATHFLTRVLVSHRILSPAAVSRLVLLWYNPATRDEPSVLNPISLFLDIFPYMSKEAHECVEASFLPVLRVLFNAPRASPFASVNISNVAELLVSITRPSIIQKAELKGICKNRDTKWVDDWSAHDDFAVMVSNEVLGDPMSPHTNTLCRILTSLDLNPKLGDNLKDVEVLCGNMLKDVKDKQAIRHLRKFQTQVAVLIKQNKAMFPVGNTETEDKENDPSAAPGEPASPKQTAPEPAPPKRLIRRKLLTPMLLT